MYIIYNSPSLTCFTIYRKQTNRSFISAESILSKCNILEELENGKDCDLEITSLINTKLNAIYETWNSIHL